MPQLGKEILYLTQRDVTNIGLSNREVIELVRIALVEHGRNKYEMPAKIGLHPKKDTLMHAMPAWVPSANACGIKWAECFPDNYKYNLPQTSGLLILNCPETGWPLAILDAIWITAKRTPAVSALACEFLAKTNTQVVGIIGAGIQGREHVQMLPDSLPKLKQIKITDRFPDVVKKLISDLQPKIPSIELRACDTIEEVVRGSLVVVSATAILAKPNPQIRDEWIEPGAFIAPVDFDSLWEFDTFSRANKFLVDSQDEMKYFMTIGYLPLGLPKVHGEIGEVIAGLKPGRESDDELIIDMNIGMGIEDVVLARHIFDCALLRGVGTVMPL